VLVIDDDSDSLELSERILAKRGFSVITASSGEAGVQAARKKTPDIIVLDVIMPGMDGWQVLEALKEDAQTRDIPIIMQSMLSERELGLAKGADDYLTKPIDKSKLTGAIRQLLPGVNTEKGLLVVEEGAAVTDLIASRAKEEDWELVTQSDINAALKLVEEREFGIVLLGKHSNTDEMAALMQHVAHLDEANRIPIVLLSSIDLDEYNADQLLSYLNIVHSKPS
jgi:DNA-binding response OmpR family regulator